MNARSKAHRLVRNAVLLVTLLVAVGLPAAASAEATTTTTSFTRPFTRLLTYPCLAEPVLLEGTLHVVLHTTVDANGEVLTTRHFQPMGITGVGQVTGTIYHATGVTETIRVGSGPPPTQFTFVNNFRIVGEADGPNYLVHEVVHFTIDANGELRADFEQGSIECR
jgi:hypothetical protein